MVVEIIANFLNLIIDNTSLSDGLFLLEFIFFGLFLCFIVHVTIKQRALDHDLDMELQHQKRRIKRIENLKLNPIVCLDYQDMPVSTIEKDAKNNFYLSHLINVSNKEEIRAIFRITKEEKKALVAEETSVYRIFFNYKEEFIYLNKYSLIDGELLETNCVTKDFFINKFSSNTEIEL